MPPRSPAAGLAPSCGRGLTSQPERDLCLWGEGGDGCGVVSGRLGGPEPRGFMTKSDPGSAAEGSGDLAFLAGRWERRVRTPPLPPAQRLTAVFFRNVRSGVYLGKKGRGVAVCGRVLHCGTRELRTCFGTSFLPSQLRKTSPCPRLCSRLSLWPDSWLLGASGSFSWSQSETLSRGPPVVRARS